MVRDLTKGNVTPVLVRFTIPLFISVIFQQVYNLADSVIVGKFVGEDPLAAVGLSYPIIMIFMSIAFGCNIGCSVIVSQLFGSKNFSKMKTAIFTSLTAFSVIAIILTALGAVFTDSMLVMLGTPENIFADASTYLRVYMYGFSFVFLYNVCTGIFTSLGDSKTPLVFLIVSSLSNIALDLFFVIVLQMGVAGAAWATFIAQGGAAIFAVVTLVLRINNFAVVEKFKYFDLGVFKLIGTVALPSVFQQSFVSVGNIILQGIINSYGSSAIAGVSCALKLCTFSLTCLMTVGNGVSAFSAQNIGAGNVDRVKKGYKAGVIMMCTLSIPFIIMLFFFTQTSLMLFMDSTSQEALSIGIHFLRVVAPFFPVICVKFVGDNVLRGTGQMRGFLVSTISDLILRVILSFAFSAQYGVNGIALSWPIGWMIGAVIATSYYFNGSWQKKKIK